MLAWNQPLPVAAAAWLSQGWSGREPLALHDTWVVVPTRQAGRRLREALAAHAAERGQAVFPPRVLLPDQLTQLGVTSTRVAPPVDLQLAWTDVLRGIDLAHVRNVFPSDPPQRTLAWARRLALRFIELQRTLANAGRRLVDVASHVEGDPDFPETDRWIELGQLESQVDQLLERRGLQHPEAARLATVREGAPPPMVPARICVVATPDPSTLAVEALSRWSAVVRIDVLVHAPDEETAGRAFDPFGRPRREYWRNHYLTWPGWAESVHLCADPAAQAEKILSFAQAYVSPEGLLAIGVADADLTPVVAQALENAGVPSFDPSGKPGRMEGLHALLQAVSGLIGRPGWDEVSALLRCPAVLHWLSERGIPKFDEGELLRQADELWSRHLPPTLDAARRHASTSTSRFLVLGPALEAIHLWRERVRNAGFPHALVQGLSELFEGTRIALGSTLARSASAWTTSLQALTEAVDRRGEPLGSAEMWEWALAIFAERVEFGDKPAGALELNSWLELLWEDAPHVVVAGLNDGRVPTAVNGDAFLPESLRRKLGLETNEDRFARDAYLLSAITSRGERGGRVDMLVGKVSGTGDPLRPSRLLLQCPDDELAHRVSFLFRAADATRASLPWMRAWQLRPRLAGAPGHLSVTSIRDWLDCPFRFYLKHVLKMAPVDTAKAEMDARDFGTLLHAALQCFGRADLLDVTDEALLTERLLAEYELAVRRQFGDGLTLPLLIQVESGRQRLRKVAALQAAQRAEGWRVDRIEWKFEAMFGGVAIRGTIDRVDRHVEDPRRVRVVDYKTSDTAVTPAKAHLKTRGRADGAKPDWQGVNVRGKDRIWIDLQLPLYRRALAAEFGPDIACGYINLPKAAGDTALSLWDDLTPDLQRSAEECADRVVQAIRCGWFWPPSERADDPDWGSLFHQGEVESIAPEVREALRARPQEMSP